MGLEEQVDKMARPVALQAVELLVLADLVVLMALMEAEARESAELFCIPVTMDLMENPVEAACMVVHHQPVVASHMLEMTLMTRQLMLKGSIKLTTAEVAEPRESWVTSMKTKELQDGAIVAVSQKDPKQLREAKILNKLH